MRFLLYPCLFAAVFFFSSFAGAASTRFSRSHRPPWAGPVAFSEVIHVGGAAIRIDFRPGNFDLPRRDIVKWVDTAAQAVSLYYGGFPVPRARVLIVPGTDERGVLSGTTWGGVDGYPAFTRMRLGQHTTQQELANDWTMTHEFVHTAFPGQTSNHHWIEEGLATYVEPIARAQLGTQSTKTIWGEMLRGMPQGEPALQGDGLDNTHTWASTYWGGALFCLMADVAIREKTHDRRGLQDALRAIVSAGGTINRDWPLTKAFAVGDRATGTSVLIDLYGKMGKGPDPVALNALWKQLGVSFRNGEVVFNSHAPLARIRESITTPGLPGTSSRH